MAGPRQLHARGVREGRLDGADIRFPLNRLVCLSAAVGQGAEAFVDRVLIGEGRRRYLLCLPPAERESLGGAGAAARIDGVDGLSAAQRVPRAPAGGERVGSHLRLTGDLVRLVQTAARIECPRCGGACAAFCEEGVAAALEEGFASEGCLVVAPLPLKGTAPLESVLSELVRAGFGRVRSGDRILRVQDVLAAGSAPELVAAHTATAPRDPIPSLLLHVVVDRLSTGSRSQARVGEAVRNARAVGRGRTLLVGETSGREMWVNPHLTCTACGRICDEPDWEALLAGSQAVVLEGLRVQVAGEPLGQLAPRLRLGGLTWLAAAALGEAPAGALAPGAAASASRLRLAASVAEELAVADLPLQRPVADLSHAEQLLLGVAGCLLGGLSGVLYAVVWPLSALDRPTRDLAVSGLRRLVAGGSTVVVVDSDPSAREWADAVVQVGAAAKSSAGRVPSTAPSGPAPPARPRPALRIESVEALPPALAGLPLPLEIPLGHLVILSGPRGSGKTALLRWIHRSLAGSGGRRGQGSRGEGRRDETRRPAGGVRAAPIRRCIDLTAEGQVETGRGSPVLAESLGLCRPLARLYAAGPAARELGLQAEHFLLDGPGGRCATCEGRGVVRHELEFVDDLTTVCTRCHGRRYRDEVLQVTLRGVTIAQVLEMSVAEAADHFARERSLQGTLAEAVGCGLGAPCLGDDPARLETGERLRARLAFHLVRARDTDLFLLDRPAAGEGPEDASQVVGALERLVKRGASVLVADASGRFDSARVPAAALTARQCRQGRAEGPCLTILGTPLYS